MTSKVLIGKLARRSKPLPWGISTSRNTRSGFVSWILDTPSVPFAAVPTISICGQYSSIIDEIKLMASCSSSTMSALILSMVSGDNRYCNLNTGSTCVALDVNLVNVIYLHFIAIKFIHKFEPGFGNPGSERVMLILS